ncbi:MAG: hypothetical protein HYV35_04125 [Lentisphaerae bacterium]|nr:hypothetical protein [Lentisphaerota bacterium]
MGDAFFAHEWTEDFEALDDITDKFRMFVYWYRCFDEDVIIGTFEPGSNRIGINQEDTGGLGERPTVGGHEFKDKLAFKWDIIGAMMGRSSGHTGVLDTRDFFEVGCFGNGLVTFDSQPDALDGAIGGPGAGMDQGPMGKRDDMKNGLADVIWKEIEIGLGKPFGITHGKFSFFDW